jgi:hypothetical protein
MEVLFKSSEIKDLFYKYSNFSTEVDNLVPSNKAWDSNHAGVNENFDLTKVR